MAKSREGKDSEFYLSQIRSLKKENKQLQQRLKVLERKEHIFDQPPLEAEDFAPPEPLQRKCDSCGKGTLEVFEIIGKVFSTCNVCGERKKS